jgi:RecB family exonuclease
MAIAGAADLPIFRDLLEIIVHDDGEWPAWASAWLQQLAPRRVQRVAQNPQAQSGQPPVWHACDSPQAEVMAAARLLHGSPAPTAVVVPADEVNAWIAQLQALEVPVLARESSVARASQTERLLTTMVELQQGKAVARAEVQALITTPLLQWQAELTEDARVSRGAVTAQWRLQRRSTGTLAQWLERVAAAQRLAKRNLEQRRPAIDEAILNGKLARIDASTAVLVRVLEAIAGARDRESALKLLDDLGLLRNRTVAGEAAAARQCYAALKGSRATSLADAWAEVQPALATVDRGDWIDKVQPALPTCWVVPWDAVPEFLPARRILCGLDKFPPVAGEDAWLSKELLAQLDLPNAQQRSAAAEAVVERVLAGAQVAVLSHRTRGGTGGPVSPSAWLARRLAKIKNDIDSKVIARESVWQWSRASVLGGCAELPQGYRWVPVELPPADAALAPDVARRFSALQAHGAGKPGPWTGELGVRPLPPASGYSVTSLQRYATNPYRYFLQTILGLREEDDVDDSLDSREQGVVLHAALEKPLAAKLEAGPVDAARLAEELGDQAVAEVEVQYRDQAEDMLARPVWAGEAARWQGELAVWFQGQAEHRGEDPGVDMSEAAVVAAAGADAVDTMRRGRIAAEMLAHREAADEITKQHKLTGNHGLVKALKLIKTGTDDDRAAGWAAIEAFRAAGEQKLQDLSAKRQQSLAAAPLQQVIAVERPLQNPDGGARLLDLGDGHTIPLQGSIDRVEWCPERQRLAVVDYKTGKVDRKFAEKISTGEHLQLPLYALALEAMAQQGELTDKQVPAGAQVRAIRLEFLKRDGKSKSAKTVAIDPRESLQQAAKSEGDGEASEGEGPGAVAVQQNALEVARSYALAFKVAIEAGHLTLVQRAGKDYQDRVSQAMRFIPAADTADPGAPWLTRTLGQVPGTTPGTARS